MRSNPFFTYPYHTLSVQLGQEKALSAKGMILYSRLAFAA